MDGERFDGLVRVLGHGASRRGVLGVLAGLTGLQLTEGVAKRRQRRGKHRSKAKGLVAAAAQDRKVTLCHHTGSQKKPFHVISVDESAVPAHLEHGDSVIECTNLQIIDPEICECICPIFDISCAEGSELDCATCACVPLPVCPGCEPPATCTRGCPGAPDRCCQAIVEELFCSPDGELARFTCSVTCDSGGNGDVAGFINCNDARECSKHDDCPCQGFCYRSDCCGKSICSPCGLGPACGSP